MKCKPLSEEPIIETLKVMQSIGNFVQSMLHQLYEFNGDDERCTIESCDAQISIVTSGLKTALDRHSESLQFLSEVMERLEGRAE